MKQWSRPFRTRLALRSAAVTLLVVGLLGLTSLTAGVLVSEHRERADEYRRLEGLLDTVERTVQIACFLTNIQLANEVANGLLSNRSVSRVTITGKDGVLIDLSHPGASAAPDDPPLIRPISSPFDATEETCRISLQPNAAEIRQSVLEASLFTGLLLALQLLGIGVAVVLVILRLVTRPITRVSQRLNDLQTETGQKLEIPRGNQQDEIGRLVISVNAMIDHLVNTLRTERELRIAREFEERRFRTIVENVETGIFELDAAGHVISTNPAFKRIFGLAPETDPARRAIRLGELVDGCSVPLPEFLAGVVSAPGPHQIELELSVDGKPRWVSVLLTQVETGRLQGVANDITERRLAAEAAERMAVTDPLTGLGNRRGLERRLSAAARIADSDHDYRCALILLDLDHFKEANDTYGHAVGDQVLQHVGAVLTDLVRKADYVARLGGDEFVVLLDDTGEHDDIASIIKRFLARVNEPIVIGEASVHVGASLGVAVLGDHTNSELELLRMADAAMYRAKHGGRNTYRFCGE